MSDKIPHLVYQLPALYNKQCGAIKLQGKVIHEIGNIDEFYKALGYTPEMAKKRILPDEFIWDRYFRFNDRNCASCNQLHIIEYLLKHSVTFVKQYGHECDDWIAEHAEARAACNVTECADREINFTEPSFIA